MGYYSLVVPRESAYDVVNTLGELDCLHFVDYDPTLPFINRPFANYIKRLNLCYDISRCEDTLKQIESIEEIYEE